MTTYITNIGSGKLKDLLAKLKKEDSLVIFHSSDEKQIPIDMVSLFAATKGTVEFKETGDDLETAYMIGRLSANPRAIVEIAGDSPVFDKINEFMGIKKKTNLRSSKAAGVTAPADKASKTAAENAKSGGSKDTSAKQETGTETKQTAAKKSASSGNSKKSQRGNDLVAFDNAYDNFTKLMGSLKTDKYDPATCSLGVLSAIRLMNEDPSVAFDDALPKTTSEISAKQFFKQISKSNIAKVVEAAKEVVKYDS